MSHLIDSSILKYDEIPATHEYDVNLRRMLPWLAGAPTTKRPISEFGINHVTLEPGEVTGPHKHDEEEVFIITGGEAQLTLDGETRDLKVGDMAYIPRYKPHMLVNASDEDLVLIDVYWDHQGRTEDEFLAQQSQNTG